jgi:hypothetical protein
MQAERIKLQSAQESLYMQVQESYELIPETVCNDDIKGFVDNYHTHCYEPIDYILTKHHAPFRLITHDKDFTLDQHVDVYTVSI